MSSSSPSRKSFSPHVQGLIGVILGLVVLGLVLGLLRLRRDGLAVDPTEMQLAADSPCMVQAIRDSTASGHSLTYAELDRLKARCGE